MKVWVKGEGAVSLGKRDFVAQGGQGAVYVKGSSAFKIYSDSSHTLPEGKMRELARITNPRVIRPQKMLLDSGGRAIGYSMKRVDGGFTLCQLFPRSFRNRHGLSQGQVGTLVEQLRSGLVDVHRAGALVVDLNEMNFIANATFRELYFIDVDSYQTQNYRASALMESVRDRLAPANCFSEETDWFAFAVVSFQMFAGIHPFKGKHPTIKGLDERMTQQVSVLHPEVRVPAAALDFRTIPGEMLAWYREVFERGLRTPPPAVGNTRPVRRIAAPKRVPGTVLRDVLTALPPDTYAVYCVGARVACATDHGLWVDGRRCAVDGQVLGVIAGPRDERLVALVRKDVAGTASVRLEELGTGDVVHEFSGVRTAVVHEGCVYALLGESVVELALVRAGSRLVAKTRACASVLPNATQLYPGLALQDLLGATYLSLFPQPGHTHQIRVPQLDAYRVLDARAVGGFVVLLARPKKDSHGQVHRIELRFDKAFAHYSVDVDAQAGDDLNLAVLDTGVCAMILGDEQLDLSHTAIGSSARKLVADPSIGGSLRLLARDAELLAYGDGTLSRLRMS